MKKNFPLHNPFDNWCVSTKLPHHLKYENIYEEGREGSLFIWVQRGLNGNGKARQKTLAPPGVFLAPPRVSSVSAPGHRSGGDGANPGGDGIYARWCFCNDCRFIRLWPGPACAESRRGEPACVNRRDGTAGITNPTTECAQSVGRILLNLKVVIPRWFYLQLSPVASLANKGLPVINGIISSEDQQGPVQAQALVLNTTTKPYTVKLGQKITQGFLLKSFQANSR